MFVKVNGIYRPEREPSCLAFYDFDPGCVVLNAGAASCAWTQGPTDSARDAVQATAIYQPAHTASDSAFAGHASIAGGSQKGLVTGTWTVGATTTIYAVARLPAATAAGQELFDLASGSRRLLGLGANNKLQIYQGNLLEASHSFSVGQVLVLCAVFGSGSGALYANDSTTALVSGDPGAYASGSAYILFNYQISSTTAFWGHSAACFGFYSGVHDAALRGQIMKHFGRKYGVNVT